MSLTQIRELHQKHKRWIPIVFFLLGFCFDAVMLQRVDELKVIIQQAVYLIVAALLIRVELIEAAREVEPPRILAKVWKYREAFLHFLLGTLLNSYTIFYFKSASAFSSFAFIAILIALLTLNEFKRFGKSQTQVHVAFLSLCLISYLVSLVPIIAGSIGDGLFLVSLAISIVVFWSYHDWVKPRLVSVPGLARTHLVLPFMGILLLFSALYFAHAIPPVPLSVTYMGIYHDVRKVDGEYQLSSTRPRWKFWQHGDQTFVANPGDSIFCYVQVFSPSRFKEELQVRWLYWDRRQGWQPSDAIPMPIVGGREEGYRGVTKKNNYQPGDWRVQIETRDGREIGRIGFKVVPANENSGTLDTF
jgi:hypothetical protein